MALPTDSSHLTRLAFAEMVPVFTGLVESRFQALSIAQGFWPSRTVTGTNSWFNRYFGKTALRAVTPGVRPDASPTTMTKKIIAVDTIVLARNNVDLLNDIQADFGIIQETSDDQGKSHARFFDMTFFTQLSKGAAAPAIAGIDGAIPGGKQVSLSAAETTDPDVLAEGITEILRKMREEDVPDEELRVFVRQKQFDTLLHNDKLVSKDFTTQGADFAMRKLFYISGVPIMATNAFPNTSDIGAHLLSNASNGNRYNVNAVDAGTVALIGHPRSLTAGESIRITANIWYNKEELQHFIDSYIAFGVDFNRPDVCGAVRTNP